MLQTLDVVIAFVVILTVVSLLITLAVQTLSAALSLRGKNLANALALTFQTIDPQLGAQAHSLAEHILKDPILSDSLFRAKNRAAATTPSRKTAWGLLDDLGGAFGLATAVRPGEIYRILHDLGGPSATAASQRGAPPVLAQSAAQLLAALGLPDGTAREAQAKLAAVEQIANIFTTTEQKQAVVEALGSLGSTVERASTQAYDRFQRWFGTAQDRAEQWFQVHVRAVTVVLSFLLSFALQLDTVEIFRQLHANQALTQKLIRAGSLIEAPASGSAGTPASVEELTQRFQTEKQRLLDTGFALAPAPLFHRWENEKDFQLGGHLLGMLMTAGLLTLGAPFWFNLLKNLMNLRPAVATLIERRPQSAPALPQTPVNPVPSTS